MIALWVLYVLCGLHFSDILTTIVIGVMTMLAYQCFYRRDRRVVLLVVSVAVSFLVFSYFGKLIIRRAISLTNRTDVDHRLKPDKSRGINSDGLRCAVEASDFTTDTFNIIFLGDSFTYGWDLAGVEKPFPQLVEEMAAEARPVKRIRTVNFGWVSSSPLLSERLLRDVGAKYKPGLIVLALDMTDFSDDLRYAYGNRDDVLDVSPGEFVLDRVGLGDAYAEIKRRWQATEYWNRLFGREILAPSDRFFIVNQPLEQFRPLVKETESNLERINRFCLDVLKAPFILVVLPRHYQYTNRECPKDREGRMYTRGGPFLLEPFRWLDEFKARAGFPCYSLLEDFKSAPEFPQCFEDDPHWTQAGHRVAARAMVRVLRQEGYLK